MSTTRLLLPFDPASCKGTDSRRLAEIRERDPSALCSM
jgi:hypothetical protein